MVRHVPALSLSLSTNMEELFLRLSITDIYINFFFGTDTVPDPGWAVIIGVKDISMFDFNLSFDGGGGLNISTFLKNNFHIQN